jgi:hypothetical protein
MQTKSRSVVFGGRRIIMRFLHRQFPALAVTLLLALALPSARADEWTKRTTITVNDTIQVPNKVLPSGSYVFRLLDSPSDRHIVQIFDKDGMHLITTILAIPNYRLQPTGKTVFNFWETPAGQPPAVRAWFYPGDNFGQEFVYPKGWSAQVASTSNAVVTTTAQLQEPQAAPPPAAEEQPSEPAPPPPVETAPEQAPPPPAPAEQAPPPAPEPQPVPTEPELPHTASPMPLIGLAGLLSLAGFVVLRRAASR